MQPQPKRSRRLAWIALLVAVLVALAQPAAQAGRALHVVAARRSGRSVPAAKASPTALPQRRSPNLQSLLASSSVDDPAALDPTARALEAAEGSTPTADPSAGTTSTTAPDATTSATTTPSPTDATLTAPTATFSLIETLTATPTSSPTRTSSGSGRSSPLLLGMYTSTALQSSAMEIRDLDRWIAGNGLSQSIAIAGTFMDFEFPNPEWNVIHDLDAAWELGYAPFVNIAVGTTGNGLRSAYDVASGAIDGSILAWASVYAKWTNGGQKKAFIAPLQEMNGSWVSYTGDPENYKLAYRHIQDLFVQAGVPESAVVWVFAPNGWSLPGDEFEAYYPGDAFVDVVGFSAFNFGGCAAQPTWEAFDQAFKPYLDRMLVMAPSKPIFIAQTGTVEQGGDKNAWLVEAYSRLAATPNLQGVIYFNQAKPEAGGANCPVVDWRVYDPQSGTGYQGFLEALAALRTG